VLDIDLQTQLLSKFSVSRIVGIDEVGRGAWSGPVVVGGYIWEIDDVLINGVRDSKLIKLPERERIAAQLDPNKLIIKQSSAENIDNLGITKVIRSLVLEIIEQYQDEKTLFIVDGQFKDLPTHKVLQAFKADNTYYAVAAAAIGAKVFRDNLMLEASKTYPGFAWESNRGYGTVLHTAGIKKLGTNVLHRKTFVPKSLFV